MEIKVRVRCRYCNGTGKVQEQERRVTCGYCLGTGKREEWVTTKADFRALLEEEAR